ncbi:DMT family transporter [Chthonobacter albigriseus]|uniref:DMT family transporter n=1 Tax=Chthonobacter albigriseus TaxID=1683161 RepID=UPI0015EE75D8|nr:DMT family transporter [Chthonobacter albigriseus]
MTAETNPIAAAKLPPVPWTGYSLAMAGAVLFASKGILIKLAYAENLDALTLLAWRMLLATPIYVAVGLWTLARGTAESRGAIRTGDIIKSAMVGVLGYWFASYTDFKGLETLSPQFERLILFTYPFFVVLFGALFFRQRVKPASLGAFAIAYLGLAVVFLGDVSTDGAAVAVGAAWVLSSAIAFALYQLFAKPLIARLGAPLFTSVAMTAAGLGVVGQYAATQPLSGLAIGGHALFLAVWLAIGATVLPTFLMNAALSRISAQANATISTLSPVVTLMLAVVILDEVATGSDLLGTALVIGGIGLFTLIDRRR